MRNAGLEETQPGIKIAGRNVSNVRYADNTTLMAESAEELKSLLMKVKVESEKVSFHFNPKEVQCKECSNYCTIALISHASKITLKVFQVRL